MPTVQHKARRRGRPSSGPTSLVAVRLPVGLVKQLDAIVEASCFKYRDRSELIRQTLADMVAANLKAAPLQ